MRQVKTKLNLFALLLLTLLTFSCGKNAKQKDFDYGRVENNKYVNSFFDLEVSLPSNWVVQTKEQTENLVEKSKDFVAGDNKNMNAILNASEINTANLLAVFQHELGTPVEYNPSFMLVAENLNGFSGIKTGSDYLYQVSKLLKQSQIKYEYIETDFKKVIIYNQEFYTMNLSLSYMGLSIKQVYYSTIQNGFCISAIISYINDEQKNELDKVINSMNFNK